MNPELPSRGIFLTGITGTLGKEMLRHLLLTGDEKLFLLIRRKNRFSHWDRARKILASYGLESMLGTRVHVMQGDITLPGLGLQPDDLSILRKEAQEFYHIAALTALNGTREDCFRINLGGTEEALKIALDLRKNGRLERFFYFSTAFVAGSLQTYCSFEDSLPAQPAHANFYEESKFCSETKVREAMKAGLPVTIFRPSIVVGDSQTGEVSEFNVIYPFLRLFAHGMINKLPAQRENAFNIVPIDFVVQAAVAFARRPESLGKTYHLVAKEPPTLDMFLKLKEEEYPSIPDIELVDPETFEKDKLDPAEQMMFQILQPYLGYLTGHLTFDASNTANMLSKVGLVFPVTDYGFVKTLCRYAFDAGYLILQ